MILKEILDNFNSLSEEEQTEALNNDYKTPEDVQGLKDGRDRLIVKNKKLQKSTVDEGTKELLEYLSDKEISSKEDLNGLFETSTEDKNKTSKEFDKYKKMLDREKEANSRIKDDLAKERNIRMSTEKINVINKELSKYELASGTKDVLLDYFSNKSTVELDSDTGALNVVSKDDELSSMSEVISEWSKTDKAVNFLKAPANVGAGSNQRDKTNSTEKMSAEEIAKVPDRQERIRLMDKHGI